jgi:hypothetical protein
MDSLPSRNTWLGKVDGFSPEQKKRFFTWLFGPNVQDVNNLGG